MAMGLGGPVGPTGRASKGKRAVPQIDHYQVEDAARTIARAQEHMKDRNLMKAVKSHVAGLSAAVGIKSRRP